MTITINGDNIDFTLEKERTAGDVLQGISSWLEESGMLVSGIDLDGQAVIIADEDWKSTEIDSIGIMGIEAVGLREGRIRQLETARDYFVLLNRAAEDKDSKSLKELSDGFPDLNRILPHLLGESSSPEISGRLRAVLQEAGFPTGEGEPDCDVLVRESESIAMLLEKRRREIADAAGEARAAAAALAAVAAHLDDVAVNLQTGKDKAAMETIIVLTELLQALMRALSWREEASDTGEIMNDMTGILAELEDALKASDTVLIGDLLEYEIKPRLEELPGRLGVEAAR